MAVAEHNVSRRALLGAALALPVGDGIGIVDLLPTSLPQMLDCERHWQRALAGFEAAQSALAAAAGDPDEDGFDRALDPFAAALRSLMRTPAPGLQALALKIELSVDYDVAALSGAAECLAALKQDARRLAGSPGSSGDYG